MAQLFTAIAAFAGTATAIAVSSESWMEERLLWITAGGFVYLAGTTILPEVLNDEGLCGRRSGRMVFRLSQLFAFSLGILFMGFVDWLSDNDHDHLHAHAHTGSHDNRQALHEHKEL
jgi:zinc transporter ZupT